MPKRCIGIDIGRSHVCAAQVVRTAEGVRVEKAFVIQTRRSSDSLPEILHSLTEEHGFDRRAETVVCLPLQAFFFADIETDATGLEKIQAGDITELSDCLPLPADDIVAQVCSVLREEGGRNSVLVAATSKEQLRERLQMLGESRIKPACIDTPITAAQRTIAANHPEFAAGMAVILYMDESTLSLAVTHEGSLLAVRNIPMFRSENQEMEIFTGQTADIVTQEIEITWQRLFDNNPDSGLRIFVVAPDQVTASLASAIRKKTDHQVIPVNPFAQTARSDEVDEGLPLSVAEGLTLGALQPEGRDPVDFLAAYRVRTRPGLRLSRELTVCAALAAAVVVVWTVGLFLQLSSLETNNRLLKEQMEAVFRRAVPEEKNIVDPTAQLQQHLDTLHKESEALTSLNSDHPSPLEVLESLSRKAPATADFKLQDVLIAADSVRITGCCDSFATFAEWQRLLETIPGWRIVDVPSPRKNNQGKVQFTISLSTVPTEA